MSLASGGTKMMNHKSTTNGRKSGMIAGTILALLIAADVTVMTAGHARAWEGESNR